jgi:hypothetical protein
MPHTPHDKGPDGRPVFTVAPSDLTFLARECTWCFYLKINRGVRRPPTPFPKVFGVLDRRQRYFFHGKQPSSVDSSLAAGRLDCTEIAVQSAPLPAGPAWLRFRGTLDCLATFDNGTVGIIDFKTTEPADDTVDLYSLQLHAYAAALRHPAAGTGTMVSRLGLLCFEPKELRRLPNGGLVQRIAPTWLNIDYDNTPFSKHCDGLAAILAASTPPQPTAACWWCRYRLASRTP